LRVGCPQFESDGNNFPPGAGYVVTEAKMKKLARRFAMMVARDGIEPPTPAFSGLDSAVAI
jgi:hypothetical protein